MRTFCGWRVGEGSGCETDLPALREVAGEEHAFEFFGKVDLKSGRRGGVRGRCGGGQRGGARGRDGVREGDDADGGQWVRGEA